MRKWIMLVAVLALVAAACGDDASSPETTASAVQSETSDAPATTAAPGTTETAAPSEGGTEAPATTQAAPPPVDGPAAPDFALALGSGDEFVLSDEQKPVYLVFWAEW